MSQQSQHDPSTIPVDDEPLYVFDPQTDAPATSLFKLRLPVDQQTNLPAPDSSLFGAARYFIDQITFMEQRDFFGSVLTRHESPAGEFSQKDTYKALVDRWASQGLYDLVQLLVYFMPKGWTGQTKNYHAGGYVVYVTPEGCDKEIFGRFPAETVNPLRFRSRTWLTLDEYQFVRSARDVLSVQGAPLL